MTWSESVRADFPILSTTVHGKPLVYLDNAATAQKPVQVLERQYQYLTEENANIHRGVHHLSQVATKAFDDARVTTQIFLNAAHSEEIIFTKGCTESLNLVAASWGHTYLTAGDQVLVSHLEHHSNIVPWQMICEQVGASVVVIPITDSGEIDLEVFQSLLASGHVKMVAVNHASNALGTINPVAQMIAMAHGVGALVLVDGAQAGPHLLIDVQALDADFYTLSCHKIYAPTGVGVLYGKRALLEAMPPYQGGGDMIRTVSFEKSTYAELPAKFEAGTPNMSGVIGFGAAIEYLASLGTTCDDRLRLRDHLSNAFTQLGEQESQLLTYATESLSEIEGLKLYGTSKDKVGVISFTLDNAHPHDVGTILDSEGIAVRTGHHCCMPLMRRLGVPATSRASFALYNTKEEVDALISGVRKVREMFA